MKKALATIGTVLIGAILLSGNVEAGLGVSPALVENRHIKPGSEYKKELTISQSDPNTDLDVTLEPDLGEANSWVSFDPGNQFTIPKGNNKYAFSIAVKVPAGAQEKLYKGALRIKATPAGAAAAGGVSVVKGARVELNFEVTSKDFSSLTVRGIDIDDSEVSNSLNIKLKIENNGNVDNAPSAVEVKIMDLNQKPLQTLMTTDIEKVRPGEIKEVVAKVNPANLDKGEYFANVKVTLDGKTLREEKIAFRILAATPASNNPDGPGAMGKLDPNSTNALLVGILGLLAVLVAVVYVLIRVKTRWQTQAPKAAK